MKLIPLTVFAIILAVDCRAQEHYTFPPQFSTPHPNFPPDKSPYLPPEPHTPIPYFSMKNINLPFPFLPPSGTRAPVPYPPTQQIVISSTYRPTQNNDDDKEDGKLSSPHPPYSRNKLNRTEVFQNQRAERREFRPIPKNFQVPIDRIDTKFPIQFTTNTESPTQNEKIISPRSIVVSDFQRKDIPFDQSQASSFQSTQYIPQNSIFISSTTETSIPILRLSNEMDLDGSFSYEALGADQTHYVQHSRMENMGEGKEEQVVEGSYSYVGDNGKTYTVHYIADANGFRAIGDHLPVAPPVPEIIQRSIQYNLAEEAKRPPSLKSWSDEQKENEVSESERRNQFAISQPRIKNLFTGKTPQSFSHSFSEQHNLATAVSTQNPMVATIDFTSDQMQSKQNSGTISPQITFLASQGAHVPSPNTPQQTIARMFTSEKSTMPQLMNYEASIKEPDQESNKALWRWQYGINANSNPNIDKTSISRSFGEDDVSINFGDMTQEQYTKIINQELDQSNQHVENSNAYDIHDQYINSNTPNSYNSNNFNYVKNSINTEPKQFSTETITNTDMPSTSIIKELSLSNNPYVPNTNNIFIQKHNNLSPRSKIITQQQFTPPNQIVTQTYDYVDNEFESRKSKIMTSEVDNINDGNLKVVPLNFDTTYQNVETKVDNKTESILKTTTSLPSIISTMSSAIKFSDFIVSENKDGFKPLLTFEPEKQETTTVDNSLENLFTENLFLKNMLNNNKNNQNQNYNNNNLQENKNLLVKSVDALIDPPSVNDHHPKSYNEVKNFKSKPVDVAEVLNLMTKNHQFESSKLKSRPQQIPVSYNFNSETYYAPVTEEHIGEEPHNRNFRTIQQQEELRGAIKNYKVLQRNHNKDRTERDNYMDRFRNGLDSYSVKSYKFPPLRRAGPVTKPYLS